jgi:putative ABC transport system ATP-binding protein
MRLELKDVVKLFDGPSAGQPPVRALDGASLSVDAGEFVAIEGPSGCGKTTLLLTAGGLLTPSQGQVLVDGHSPYDLAAGARAAWRGEHIGFLFQQFYLIEYLTLRENVLAAQLGDGAADQAARADEMLARLGLSDRADHLPSKLSTGQRQRAALARAMLRSPKLLLADEPTGNLDSENGQAVLKCLRDYANDGAAVLLVTHDSRAGQYADRTLRMNAGRVAMTNA